MNRLLTILFTIICVGALALPAHAEFSYGAGNAVSPDAVIDANTVTARVVKDPGQLPGGPLAEGLAGDFVLKNHRAAFTIAGVRPGSGVHVFGGVVEDAAILRTEPDGARRWYNAMGTGSVFPIFFEGSEPLIGMRVFAPVKAEILKDGSDGEAIVRVTGRDADFAILADMFQRSPNAIRILVTIDYILRPDSQVLEIRTTIENKSKKAKAVNMGYGFLVGDGVRPFAPGPGFDEDKFSKGGPYSFFAAAGPSVSYGWFSDSAQINVHLILTRHIITSFDALRAKPGETATVSHYWAVGGGDIASIADMVQSHNKEMKTGLVSGTVLDAAGMPAPDAVVNILNAGGEYLNMARVGADGAFSLSLPAGEYSVQATSDIRQDPLAQSITVKGADEIKLDIAVPDPARLTLDIKDDKGKNIPATVSLKAVDAPPSAADNRFYRLQKFSAGFALTHFCPNTKETIRIKPGKYDMYVSRGLEYEYVKKTIEIPEGGEIAEAVTLPRVVDTAGWLCGDFHLHAESSHDSSDLRIWKVAGLAAAGVEIPVATDHDRVADYTPAIQALGLEREIKSIKGDEITSARFGHFNAFPLTYDPAAPNQGAVVWMGLSPGEFFQAARDNNPAPRVVQINHPRTAAFGYLAYIDYRPETATAGHPELLSFNFDAIEVLNGTFYEVVPGTMQDWFSRLDRGHRVTGTGNSDSHRVFTLEAGYPRNYVRSATDIPGDMVEADFIQSILGQHVTVSGGPFITAAIDGKGPGETASAQHGQAMVDITVQAPSWILFDKVTVLQGGKEIASLDVTGAETPVRFAKKVPMKVTADTWVIVIAEGGQDLFPVYPGTHAYSFTNPIFIDADGNGVYDPPLKESE
jgi:hypothetical protein